MPQFNVRDMPERAARQLGQLVEREGLTKTQAVIIAIGAMWDEAHKRIHFDLAQAEAGVCPWCGWDASEEQGEGNG